MLVLLLYKIVKQWKIINNHVYTWNFCERYLERPFSKYVNMDIPSKCVYNPIVAHDIIIFRLFIYLHRVISAAKLARQFGHAENKVWGHKTA